MPTRAALAAVGGEVVNVILIGDDPYDPGDGLTVHPLPNDSPVGLGWALVDGEWVEPEPEPDDPA